MSPTVGIYRRRWEADTGARRLLDAGVRRREIGVLMSRRTQERLFSRVPNAGDEILAPLATDAVQLPALGVVAAGAIVAELSGLSATSLGDAFVMLGLDAGEAARVTEAVQSGHVVICDCSASVDAVEFFPYAEDDVDPSMIRFSLIEIE